MINTNNSFYFTNFTKTGTGPYTYTLDFVLNKDNYIFDTMELNVLSGAGIDGGDTGIEVHDDSAASVSLNEANIDFEDDNRITLTSDALTWNYGRSGYSEYDGEKIFTLEFQSDDDLSGGSDLLALVATDHKFAGGLIDLSGEIINGVPLYTIQYDDKNSDNSVGFYDPTSTRSELGGITVENYKANQINFVARNLISSNHIA